MLTRDSIRYIAYRTERTRTTWTFRVVSVAAIVLLTALLRPWWVAALGRSLVCAESVGPTDAIVIENVDPDYLLFERAAALLKAGVAPLVVAPVAGRDGTPNRVAEGFVAVMSRVAHLDSLTIVPVQQDEPITLNMALQLRRFLKARGIRSLVLVTSAFRSKRSALVYTKTFGDIDVAVHCVPVFGTSKPETWFETWHGIQAVVEQVVKLQYYRFYVLPFVAGEYE